MSSKALGGKILPVGPDGLNKYQRYRQKYVIQLCCDHFSDYQQLRHASEIREKRATRRKTFEVIFLEMLIGTNNL